MNSLFIKEEHFAICHMEVFPFLNETVFVLNESVRCENILPLIVNEHFVWSNNKRVIGGSRTIAFSEPGPYIYIYIFMKLQPGCTP